MSGTTTNYSWTYPSEGDAPDGAAQMQTIATAVDSTVHGIDVRVATLEGEAPNKPPVVYTATGTSTFTATQAGHATYLKITGCNSGSGGGGCPSTASNTAAGGGGGGGAAAVRTIAVAGLTFPLQVTVGNGGGAGGTTGLGSAGIVSIVKDNNGAGATLWFPGTPNVNSGGAAGTVGTAARVDGAAGFEVATTGAVADAVFYGSPGSQGIRFSGTQCQGGAGGASGLGMGGGGSQTSNNQAGGPGWGYGGGGAGASTNGSGTFAGGSGLQGIVIIEPIF